MPTILQDGPYTFVFFSSDRGEPLHVHAKRDKRIAKYWLQPISLAKNIGFAAHELRQIERLVRKHQDTIVEAWYEYFGA
jgi:Domain of unknown function (DUF4160)